VFNSAYQYNKCRKVAPRKILQNILRMKISYKWLRDYLNTSLNPFEIAAALTQIGLETGSVEEVESVKGGLKGLVVGEVVTCGKHPGSDHLSITTVNLGGGVVVPIVCGAPNVAAG
jgi:phenylalanyl-tRNA synthetase beta chain